MAGAQTQRADTRRRPQRGAGAQLGSLAAKSGVDNATAQLIMAKEFPNPTASLSTYKIGSHEAGTVMGNGLWDRSYDSIAAVSQLIEIGGKRQDRQTVARAGMLGAKARFYDAQRTLTEGVTQAYIAALLAAENERILNESAGLMRHEADIAQAQFNAGDLPRRTKRRWKSMPDSSNCRPDPPPPPPCRPASRWKCCWARSNPRELDAGGFPGKLVAAATAAPRRNSNRRHPPGCRLAAETDLEGGEAELKLQKAMRIPDPTVSLGAEHNPPGGGPAEDTLNIGGVVPPAVVEPQRGNIKAAQAAVDQFREALGKSRTQAMADLANAESAYDEAYKRWLRYRDEIGPQIRAVRDCRGLSIRKRRGDAGGFAQRGTNRQHHPAGGRPSHERHRQRGRRLDGGAHGFNRGGCQARSKFQK